jgi:hypothetical protein
MKNPAYAKGVTSPHAKANRGPVRRIWKIRDPIMNMNVGGMSRMNSVQAHDIAQTLAEDLRNADTPLGIAFRKMSEKEQAYQILQWIIVLIGVKA